MFIWPILHLSEKYDDLIIIAKQAQQESLVDRGQKWLKYFRGKSSNCP